jgi:hypothetical protein
MTQPPTIDFSDYMWHTHSIRGYPLQGHADDG